MGLTDKKRLLTNVDWRTSGCISSPREQENCGSCYAFATISALEAMRCIESDGKVKEILSPQMFVDCVPGGGSLFGRYGGCRGSTLVAVASFLQKYDA